MLVVEANGGPGFAKTKILFSKYDRELRPNTPFANGCCYCVEGNRKLLRKQRSTFGNVRSRATTVPIRLNRWVPWVMTLYHHRHDHPSHVIERAGWSPFDPSLRCLTSLGRIRVKSVNAVRFFEIKKLACPCQHVLRLRLKCFPSDTQKYLASALASTTTTADACSD